MSNEHIVSIPSGSVLTKEQTDICYKLAATPLKEGIYMTEEKKARLLELFENIVEMYKDSEGCVIADRSVYWWDKLEELNKRCEAFIEEFEAVLNK